MDNLRSNYPLHLYPHQKRKKEKRKRKKEGYKERKKDKGENNIISSSALANSFILSFFQLPRINLTSDLLPSRQTSKKQDFSPPRARTRNNRLSCGRLSPAEQGRDAIKQTTCSLETENVEKDGV